MRGSCLCGEVRFEISGDLPNFYQCHCKLCRKQGGSASNSATIVDAAAMRWVAGEALISSYVRPTGFRSDFCSRCGSPVPNPLRKTAYYWVPAGLFDDETDREICVHLYVDSKASWDTIPPAAPQYQEGLKLSAFIDRLHGKG
jgi:hypothetical protein